MPLFYPLVLQDMDIEAEVVNLSLACVLMRLKSSWLPKAYDIYMPRWGLGSSTHQNVILLLADVPWITAM